MNRHCHRVVFNAARGLRMAVAECTRALGAGTAAATTTLVLALPTSAQILRDTTAPGQQQPVVLPAGNGVPVVNITTPSAAGVSRNTYRQFDVGPAGAVLNNAPTGASTRLGGTVPPNPWLASGGARVILNEVNSPHPSRLHGFIEVAGSRAEVVIANPAGIVVNGGGFINASRATLTTGTPRMAGDVLDGFAVRTGSVRIEGAGLDVTGADHAQILARAVELNATVWARDLTLVTGANDIGADGERVDAVTPAGPAPRFALDVTALGGMYADKIRLIGTEVGLGVNHAGLISAQGELTLAVNGWLDHTGAARTYGGQISMVADGVLNGGHAVLAARDTLTVEARDAIINRDGALIFSGGNMALAARGRIENRSAILLSGCLYGQCMDGPCALEREAYLKSIKAYGTHWVKAGVSTEQWGQDWVRCGGVSNGHFVDDAPPNASDEVVFAAIRRKRRELALCMSELGYAFRPGTFREP